MTDKVIISKDFLDELISEAEDNYKNSQIGLALTIGAIKYETLTKAKSHFLSSSIPVETVIKDAIVCPFCNDGGFDLPGLKNHFIRYCERYNDVDTSDFTSIFNP